MSNTKSLFESKNFYLLQNGKQYSAGIGSKSITDISKEDVKKIYGILKRKIKLETSKELGFGNKTGKLDSLANDISKIYEEMFDELPEVSNYPKLLEHKSTKSMSQIQSKFIDSLGPQVEFIELLNKVGGFGTLSTTTNIADVLDSIRRQDTLGGYSKALGSFIEAIAANRLKKYSQIQIDKIPSQLGLGDFKIEDVKATGSSSNDNTSTINKGDIFNKITVNKDGSIVSINLGASVKATSSSKSKTFSATGGLNITKFSNKEKFYDSIMTALVWHRHILRQKELSESKDKIGDNKIYSFFAAALVADYAFLGEDRPLVLFTFTPNASNEGVFKAKFMYQYFEKMHEKEMFPTVYSKSLKEFYMQDSKLSIQDIYSEAKKNLLVTVDITAKFIMD